MNSPEVPVSSSDGWGWIQPLVQYIQSLNAADLTAVGGFCVGVAGIVSALFTRSQARTAKAQLEVARMEAHTARAALDMAQAQSRTAEEALRNTKQKEAALIIDDHKIDREFKIHIEKIRSSFPVNIPEKVHERELRRSIRYVANFYERVSHRIVIGLIDEHIVKNSIKNDFILFYKKSQPYISGIRVKRQNLYENFVRLYENWSRDE